MNNCAVNKLKDNEVQILLFFFPAIFCHFWKQLTTLYQKQGSTLGLKILRQRFKIVCRKCIGTYFVQCNIFLIPMEHVLSLHFSREQ